MHLHQVLTGAVNPGDCCYSVGSVNDIPFTVGILYVDVHLTWLATKLASYVIAICTNRDSYPSLNIP